MALMIQDSNVSKEDFDAVMLDFSFYCKLIVIILLIIYAILSTASTQVPEC